MEYREFESKILKRSSKNKHFKVKNSWGVYDAYKLIRKNGWYDIGRPLKEQEFYTIVRQINKILVGELLKGNSVIFPQKMGRLELRKTNRNAKFKKGKLIISYPIDWHKTLHLWYEDGEARREKILLRNESGKVFKVIYSKYGATYENQIFYEFTLNRDIRNCLKESIQQGKTETLW